MKDYLVVTVFCVIIMIAAVIISVRLVYNDVTNPPPAAHQLQLNIQAAGFSVPNVAKSHTCFGIDIHDSLNGSLWHATNFSLVVDNTEVVQKIIFHGCLNRGPEGFYTCDSIPEDCMSFVWAPPLDGSTSFGLNEEAGVLFGEDPEGITFAVLHIYYYNPDLVTGYVDNSGVTIDFTDALRPNNAGTFTIFPGAFTLPGNDASTSVTSICNVPASITAIGYSFQEHYFGTNASLESSTELIGEDNQYSFIDSGFTSLPNNGTNIGSSHLTFTCTYDTLSSLSPVASGLEPDQEECSAFILYYPKMDTVFCNNATSYY